MGVFFKLGFLSGYLMYDLCHYGLHHVDTTKNKGSYFHKLQRYHNQHHFGG
jgi:sterol desaturase/sphingolipid hydroxylase (fatty acid hydroxylase superfamily)